MTTISLTARLQLRHITGQDAPFYRQLVNEPEWIAHIGDRQVHSVAQAALQIEDRLVASYVQHGYGLYLVALRATGAPVGICGLVQRSTLQHPDLGFAFLQAHIGQGYALEAAQAVLLHAFDTLHLKLVLGITTSVNRRSARLLEKLGFKFQGEVQLGQAVICTSWYCQAGVSLARLLGLAQGYFDEVSLTTNDQTVESEKSVTAVKTSLR